METDALLGSASNPSVGNAARQLVKSVTLQGGLSTQPFRILKSVDGVLRPGRFTLLLGPPGAGKSVLLQTLAGRLRPSKSLRVSGRGGGRRVPGSACRAGLWLCWHLHPAALCSLPGLAAVAAADLPAGRAWWARTPADLRQP